MKFSKKLIRARMQELKTEYPEEWSDPNAVGLLPWHAVFTLLVDQYYATDERAAFPTRGMVSKALEESLCA